jgi:hypothetical protein
MKNNLAAHEKQSAAHDNTLPAHEKQSGSAKHSDNAQNNLAAHDNTQVARHDNTRQRMTTLRQLAMTVQTRAHDTVDSLHGAIIL